MQYQKNIIDLANKYNLTPAEVFGVSLAFDYLVRLAMIENIQELNNTILEQIEKKKNSILYIYNELPDRVKDICKKSLEKFGTRGIAVFYNPYKKPKNLELFLRKLIENNIQPKEFYFDGTLTYRNLKNEPMEDNTLKVEIVEYK